MKRKTNLFYTSGYDSKFLTFSNYTESLTGNFLSTNTKLFPSRFIALKINGLTEDSKKYLIKYLALYYESKLAACRDALEKNDELPEDSMLPLNYLLEALYSISELTDDYLVLNNGYVISDNSELDDSSFDDSSFDDLNELTEDTTVTDNESENTSDDTENDIPAGDDNNIVIDSTNYDESKQTIYENEISSNDDDGYIDDLSDDSSVYIEELENLIPNFENTSVVELKYISDITEQNYNGTFTDTICVVDLDDYHYPTITHVSTNPDADIIADDNIILVDTPISSKTGEQCIYGWENYDTISLYEHDKSLFDGGTEEVGQYRLNSYITKLQIEGNDNKAENIEFNCIIPLFDLVNIDTKSSFATIKEATVINLLFNSADKDENSIYKLYNLNVPLGIWLYTNGDDNVIRLYRDKETGFSQSWSLTISSQFKPFPYSKSMPNEICTNSDSAAYMTFAQVLSNQNAIIEKFEHISYQFMYFDKRMADMQSQLNNIGTLYNIDKIHQEFIDFNNEMNNKYDKFKDDVLSYINNLRWKVTQ